MDGEVPEGRRRGFWQRVLFGRPIGQKVDRVLALAIGVAMLLDGWNVVWVGRWGSGAGAAALVFGVRLVVGVGLFLVLRRVLDIVVFRRIRQMEAVARAVNKDPEGAMRFPRGGDDELDQLGRTMNDLLNQLVSVKRRLQHEALHDSLTGLGNRGLLMDRLGFLHSMLGRDPNFRFTLVLLDLDGFKDINDAFGHDAGDHVLKVVADRLRALVRRSDTVVRMGGDEFVLLLYQPTSSADFLESFMQRLIKTVREPIVWEGQELQVSCSVGVLESLDRCATCVQAPGELLRDVDIAMYQAKRSGKNRFRRFTCDLRSAVTDSIALMNELRRSIRENRLEVWYQPVVSLRDRSIFGFESLLRWNHPERGLLLPGSFIPLAEEAGLIVQLDQWALMLTVERMREIRRAVPGAHVSVNFSMKQFLHPNIVRLVRRTLQSANLPGEALAIEVTETSFVRSERQFLTAVEEFRSLGIRLFLDDFGTGYSSLNRLRQIPFDVVKIDQSFVRRLGEDDLAIVDAVVRMSHSLGKRVIAEGVETDRQVEALRAMGCDYAQGFLFAAPMPLPQLLEWAGRFSVGGG